MTENIKYILFEKARQVTTTKKNEVKHQSVRKMHIQMTMRDHFTTTRLPKSKLNNTRCW